MTHNGATIHLLNEHHGEVIHLKWNPNNKFLATAGHCDNYVDIWDLSSLGALNFGDLSALNQQIVTSSSSPKNLKPHLYLRHIALPGNSDSI
mmetsp:Transcript_14839/g.25236  ORF Transcript_14839/g.25236 Transcript_14839/m.25236 type:complete len:92 (-) Transcript_14839:1308-1583(-)